MELVNNKIISSDASVFFNNTIALDNKTLESTLRYVALNRFQGDINEIVPVSFGVREFNDGDAAERFVKFAEENELELLIAAARGGVQDFPVILDSGWVSLDSPPYPVAAFLSKASDTKVFINEELKTAIIFVKTATSRWIDMLCSVLCRVLLWRFPDKLTKTEEQFFQSINKKDADTFNSIIDEVCAKYNFRENRFKRVLLEWEGEYRQKRINELVRKIENKRNNLVEYQKSISNILNEIGMAQTSLDALQAVGDTKDDTVYKFFMNHPNIYIYTTEKTSSGNVMRYTVLETLDSYDVDEFERNYNNKGSYIYSAKGTVKKILHSIFVENRGVFKVTATFKLVNLWSITPEQYVRPNEFEFTYLPHPHLFYYGCLGANEAHIANYLERGDWDMAIEQTIAATKNINFGDSTVFGRFINNITRMLDSGDGTKCVIADNGEEMTVREFYEYITAEAPEEE